MHVVCTEERPIRKKIIWRMLSDYLTLIKNGMLWFFSDKKIFNQNQRFNMRNER